MCARDQIRGKETGEQSTNGRRPINWLTSTIHIIHRGRHDEWGWGWEGSGKIKSASLGKLIAVEWPPHQGSGS